MQGEQLKLVGNILKFPNKLEERQKKENKEWMLKFINMLYDLDADFDIILQKKDAEEIFESNKAFRDFLIVGMRSDKEMAKRFDKKLVPGSYYLNNLEFMKK